jgi:polyhydroxyalkanoate synthase
VPWNTSPVRGTASLPESQASSRARVRLSADASTQLLGGNSRFVLSTSGYIQAMVNPPSPESRSSYRLTDERTDGVEAWLAQADVKSGSWWPDYSAWLGERSGELRAAPKRLGNGRHRATAKAPGNLRARRMS